MGRRELRDEGKMKGGKDGGTEEGRWSLLRREGRGRWKGPEGRKGKIKAAEEMKMMQGSR